jgi:hypothetical protein
LGIATFEQSKTAMLLFDTFATLAGRRHEWRRGTHECVRHFALILFCAGWLTRTKLARRACRPSFQSRTYDVEIVTDATALAEKSEVHLFGWL